MLDERRALTTLAQRAGVQLAYVDPFDVRRVASADGLVATLAALGIPIERPDQASDVIAWLDDREGSRLIEPVEAVWNERRRAIPVRTRDASVTLIIENGASAQLPVKPHLRGPGGVVRLPHLLEPGVHELVVEDGARTDRCTLLLAPRRCWAPEDERPWLGVWLPLYAAWDARRPTATFETLAELGEWSHSAGCDVLGALPLLPMFLDEPFDPSPYSPISRLFWSELYVDTGASGETSATPAGPGSVDYRAVWRERWAQLCARAGSVSAAEREQVEACARAEPRLERYARFRGAMRKIGLPWSRWSDAERECPPSDEADRFSFLWAQLEARRQVRSASSFGHGLYLDLPIGVSRDGFDPFEHPDLFAMDATAGAPPDGFFASGQSWGFSPVRPRVSRESGHAWFRDSIRHHMSEAGALRIDHVVGLHRIYWIPPGAEPTEGVYVRQPFDELYAILSIESHRAQCRVIGEDLGLVPGEVRRAMARHGVLGMCVGQFEFGTEAETAIPDPAGAGGADGGASRIACLNTHDMGPFPAYWTDADVEPNVRLGVFDEARAREEAAHRARVREALSAACGLSDDAEWDEALRAVLTALAGRHPALLLVTLEDLLGETGPQNVPGVDPALLDPWRRRARAPVDVIKDDAAIADLIRSLRDALDHAPAGAGGGRVGRAGRLVSGGPA